VSEDLLLHKATEEHGTPLTYSISSHFPKKLIVLISSKRCGVVGVGLGALRKKENKFSKKTKTFSRSNYNRVSCGIRRYAM
jgi:hypothetical protein